MARITDSEQVRRKLLGLKEVPLGLVDFFAIVGERLPPRTTYRQLWALCIVIGAHCANEEVTLADVSRQVSGGDMKVALTVAKSLSIFMLPSGSEPNGLGWIKQIGDANDRRKKFLELTQYQDVSDPDDCGEALALQIIEELRHRIEGGSKPASAHD